MTIKDIREMSKDEMIEALKKNKSELMNLRFQNAINQLDNPMRIVEVKKTIARIMTVLGEQKEEN